jgi:hypothetical protein
VTGPCLAACIGSLFRLSSPCFVFTHYSLGAELVRPSPRFGRGIRTAVDICRGSVASALFGRDGFLCSGIRELTSCRTSPPEQRGRPAGPDRVNPNESSPVFTQVNTLWIGITLFPRLSPVCRVLTCLGAAYDARSARRRCTLPAVPHHRNGRAVAGVPPRRAACPLATCAPPGVVRDGVLTRRACPVAPHWCRGMPIGLYARRVVVGGGRLARESTSEWALAARAAFACAACSARRVRSRSSTSPEAETEVRSASILSRAPRTCDSSASAVSRCPRSASSAAASRSRSLAADFAGEPYLSRGQVSK